MLRNICKLWKLSTVEPGCAALVEAEALFFSESAIASRANGDKINALGPTGLGSKKGVGFAFSLGQLTMMGQLTHTYTHNYEYT